MPAKVIPDSEVEQLLRQGKTDREIVEYLEQNQHITVTRNAIAAWRRRRGMDLKRNRYSELLPWRVKMEHTNLFVPKVLRTEARLRAGEEVPPLYLGYLERFKDRLAQAFDGRGGVVHYDPDTEEGWWIVERRPGVDTDMIRNPEVP